MTPKQRSARQYFFRELVAKHDFDTAGADLIWREARLLWKGATVAALVYCGRHYGEAK
jgi:hypothetical protein